MVPVEGLEPPRPIGQQILSLQRLPFRHTGIDTRDEFNIKKSIHQQKNIERFLETYKIFYVDGTKPYIQKTSIKHKIYYVIFL